MLILKDEVQGLHIVRYLSCAELPVEVRNAMRQAEMLSIEQGYDWYLNLINTVYPGDSGIRIFVLSVDKQIFAVLPVRVVRESGSVVVVALANYYTSLYQPYIAEHATVEVMAALFRAILVDCPNSYKFTFAPLNTQCLG